MNALELIIIAIILVLAVSGFRRGFVRKMASMVSLALSVALVSAALPHVTSFIQNNTPLDTYITSQCEQILTNQLISESTGSSSTSLSDLTREQAKTLLTEYGYGSYASVIDTLSDEEFENYKEEYIQEYILELSGLSGTSSTEEQQSIIENLPLPEIVKNLLLKNNNSSGYASLNVSTFKDYVVEFLSNLILNVISFVAAVLLVRIALHIILALLDLLANAPVVGVVNRMAGLGLGILEALFFLWLFFLILAVMQSTTVGTMLLSLVEESAVLSWLYEENLFMQVVVMAASLFA